MLDFNTEIEKYENLLLALEKEIEECNNKAKALEQSYNRVFGALYAIKDLKETYGEETCIKEEEKNTEEKKE